MASSVAERGATGAEIERGQRERRERGATGRGPAAASLECIWPEKRTRRIRFEVCARSGSSRIGRAGHIEGMGDRDADAFRSLYGTHYRTVCRYLAARTDRDLVEDVAAETFLVAWRRREDLPDCVLPWLLNTAAKCLANQRRSQARAHALVDCLAGLITVGTGDIGEQIAHRSRRHALVVALASLNERDRELLLLSHWDGLAPREVAVVLGVSPVLLRARLHRASRRLRDSLADALDREGAQPGMTSLTESFRT
jgi:RNA polymerase sigma-70 factor (ECF subfamily)